MLKHQQFSFRSGLCWQPDESCQHLLVGSIACLWKHTCQCLVYKSAHVVVKDQEGALSSMKNSNCHVQALTPDKNSWTHLILVKPISVVKSCSGNPAMTIVSSLSAAMPMQVPVAWATAASRSSTDNTAWDMTQTHLWR